MAVQVGSVAVRVGRVALNAFAAAPGPVQACTVAVVVGVAAFVLIGVYNSVNCNEREQRDLE